jgi:nicotinamidase-related amidase
MKKIHLLVIDPQNDFCDPNKGSLYVNGAHEDMGRLANMIDRLSNKIDDIHITLDSHHTIHVAHSIYWKDSSGNHPAPFTIITAEDVKSGIWTTTQPSWLRHTRDSFGALDYIESLEQNGKYPLCIWPPHCLIGSWGHGVFPVLLDALNKWERDEFGSVNFVTKGSNYHTEHYSAICADVPDPMDHTTDINKDFLQTVIEADEILLAGEAGSHCLASTGRDANAFFNDDSFIKKVVLLKDATSPVTGFESLQDDFISDMTAKGMRVTTTVDYLA